MTLFSHVTAARQPCLVAPCGRTRTDRRMPGRLLPVSCGTRAVLKFGWVGVGGGAWAAEALCPLSRTRARARPPAPPPPPRGRAGGSPPAGPGSQARGGGGGGGRARRGGGGGGPPGPAAGLAPLPAPPARAPPPAPPPRLARPPRCQTRRQRRAKAGLGLAAPRSQAARPYRPAAPPAPSGRRQ